MKRCSACKQVKKLGEFGKDRSRGDGKQDRCRPCRSAANKKFRQARAAARRRYVARHPETEKAHWLAQANKSKLLKTECESCGTSKRLQMHHPDYSKPLHVITLCVSCHQYTHILIADFDAAISELKQQYEAKGLR